MSSIWHRLGNAGDQLRNLGIASAQLLVAITLAILISKWVRTVVRRRTRHRPSPTISVFAENTAAAAVYVVAFTIVLTFWGLTWNSLITALSISTVAVAFGFQDLLRSFVGGMLVVFERPFSVGDRIRLRDLEGKVERIDLRTTVVRGDNGDRISIPNALILSDPVINRSPNRVSRMVSVTGINGIPAEIRSRTLAVLTGLPGSDGLPKISIRTKQTQNRIRRAVDPLSRNKPDHEQTGGPSATRAIGMRIVWSGERGLGNSEEVKRRLLAEFPGCRVSPVKW